MSQSSPNFSVLTPHPVKQSLSEKHRTRSRPVDLDVTIRAVRVLRVQVVLRTSRLIRADIVSHAVTGQTELRDAARSQQARISRTVRRMTCDASFCLHRSMLVNKWTLLICVTLDASCISAGSKSGLFQFKTAVWIVAVAALHGSFKNLVMERQIELVLHLAMTTEAKLRFAHFEQLERRDTWLLSVRRSDKDIRSWPVSSRSAAECGEWQSAQPMSLRQCSPRRKLLCSSLPA